MNRLLILISTSIFMLFGCAASLDDYRNDKPHINLKTYFSGIVKAYGLFQDMNGKVTRRFTVDLRGEWQGDQGTLHEDFVFDDGEKQVRIWQLRDLGNGRYQGQAGDVVGEAEGIASGNALRWRYTLKVPVDGDTYEFQFDDWLWQFDDKRLFNKAKMKKFGFTVGEITLYFEKQ